MAMAQLPTTGAVATMFRDLYDLQLKVLPADQLPAGTPSVSVDFYNHAHQICVSMVADLPAVASLGAALTRMPPGGASEAASSGDVPESMMANYAEVCNIVSTLFRCGDDVAEMEVLTTTLAITPLPQGATGQAVSIELPGYPKGTLIFR